MTENIDQQLARYAKIDFQSNLENLERDVNRRLSGQKPDYFSRENFANLGKLIEEWSGVPVSTGASALASTLVLGIILGQLQGHVVPVKQDMLGFDIFSASNARLPSALLDRKPVQKK